MRFFHRSYRCGDSHCVDVVCRGPDKHRVCIDCGATTTYREIRVNPVTHRRQYHPVCDRCRHAAAWERKNVQLRGARTEADWERPIPDQYPGVTRTLIKDFLASENTDLVLDARNPESATTTINASLTALGLATTCYAEQRANHVVIRRVTVS